ncbi:MAG: helix-turn-helix domain-containing protein [Bacteroidota bacterium]
MITLLQQLIFFSFFQAILLLLVFAFSSKHRKKTNLYLIILVIVLLIGLSGRIFHIVDLFGGSRRWVGLSEFAILLFGPTVYLFTRSLISNRQFSRVDLVHYLPALCYNLIVTFYYLLPPAPIINERVASGELFRVVNILVGIGLVVNSTYYILSLQKFKTFRSTLHSELSYTVSLKFLQNFLITIGACLLTWLSIYLLSLFSIEGLERELRAFVWTAIAMIILFITHFQMLSPQVMQYSSLISNGKYQQSKFSAKDLDHLKVELDTIMEEKKPYLNQKLLKAELAHLMGISNPELARLLNERIGMSFFEYVNYHRIQEFIRLSQADDAGGYTFFGLAQRAGFNSKATFNKSFKQIMGCTPSAYFRQ